MFHTAGPLALIARVLGGLLSVVAGIIVLVVVLGLIVLLVRFLWFGTRAAQLYLMKNGDTGRFTWPVKRVRADGTPTAEERASAHRTTATTPSAADPVADPSGTAPTEVLPDNAAEVPPPVPARAPRKPKSPPADPAD